MSLLKVQYYDKPEGQDVFGKMVATNRTALAFGLVTSTYDVLFYTKPQGYIKTIGRYGYFCGPFVGMASAFTMTTYAANRLRGKDDTWNYMAGACASAGVFGAWRRNFVSGCTMAVFFCIAAAVKKLSISEGWEFFPAWDKHIYGNVRHTKSYDFTLLEERPKGYTTNRE
ncbi:NADH dehydrogenase [ubiquinone] 1 alpha subcomplex subunit 11 [Bradysia coprophila]|uniref:NADH dehydrogenase [ubiquinone] 1 alpha subcomplex subunit 11 n=1 Tax=Bradysia coprophila TaxID=38358 RepID=UPI00187DA69E|nr:NADH dehydrogenase [ubiquinone] 1 alpha subcomplex subunit 11 [Bradysia coprophila]